MSWKEESRGIPFIRAHLYLQTWRIDRVGTALASMVSYARSGITI